ncbi:MAG: Coenzyme F420 hydrogenase/dehydrogenase, beta subunit C-terminal domain [Anaerolineae bacterium]|nr:Coenzyme F420 hydrogenase/dehydrogenase, beta subunit C-terminal domain [Anaerolineae bacterium]
MIKRLRQALWHKNFTPDQLRRYVGEFEQCYFTYAADDAVHANAASGGSVSALLIYLLESGQIGGALVCRTALRAAKPRPEFIIARTREEIMVAQGSKYAAVYFANDALPLIEAFDGRLAVVALPCDATILQRARARSAALDARIALVITLFCGHNSEPALTDAIVDRLGQGHGPLTGYHWRIGHWRGSLEATFADGAQVVKPFETFSDYRNLYFFAQPKCHHCFDHFGYHCDISAGDIWSPRMKANPIKHTALIARTPAGSALIAAALRDGVLIGSEEPVDEIANGQARTAPFHYSVNARARVGRFLGVRIKARNDARVRPVDYAIAFIALLNERVSRTRIGRAVILRAPRPVIRLYLYLLKGLESL